MIFVQQFQKNLKHDLNPLRSFSFGAAMAILYLSFKDYFIFLIDEPDWWEQGAPSLERSSPIDGDLVEVEPHGIASTYSSQA